MMELFDAIKEKKFKNPVAAKKQLEKSRIVAIDALEHIFENHVLTEIQQAALNRAIDRLKNKFTKDGVVEAFNVTCNLGL